jgi:hypothetical protein
MLRRDLSNTTPWPTPPENWINPLRTPEWGKGPGAGRRNGPNFICTYE